METTFKIQHIIHRLSFYVRNTYVLRITHRLRGTGGERYRSRDDFVLFLQVPIVWILSRIFCVTSRVAYTVNCVYRRVVNLVGLRHLSTPFFYANRKKDIER